MKDRDFAKEIRQAMIKFEFAKSIGCVDLSSIYSPQEGSILGRILVPATQTVMQRRKFRRKRGWSQRSKSCEPVDRPTLERRASLPCNLVHLWTTKPARSNCGRWTTAEIQGRFHEFMCLQDAKKNAVEKERKKGDRLAVQAMVEASDTHCMLYRECVAKVFAEGIEKDFDAMLRGESVSGLAAKWVSSNDKKYEKETLIAREIMQELPERILTHTRGRDEAIRFAQVISMIRRAAKIPESFIGRKEWHLVDYSHMPSLCRNVWGRRVFWKHDSVRYDAFLKAAKEDAGSKKRGAKKVHTGALLPHDVIAKAADDLTGEVELQWYGLAMRITDARKAGDQQKYFVPVCDVSDSMNGLPMEVGISLSMLLAETAPEPLKHKMFTFSEIPVLVELENVPDHANGQIPEPGSLHRRVEQVRGMDWGGCTNFEAVFDKLLELAQLNDLTEQDIANTIVCVFSDMQFDQTNGFKFDPWETMHERIVGKWRDAGFARIPKVSESMT